MQISQLNQGYKQTKGYKTQFVFVALDHIRTGKYKKDIELCRTLPKDQRSTFKSTLTGVTWSGTFSTRRKNALLNASGLACLDFDDVIEPKKLIEDLSKDRYIFAAWLSPSATGVKALVKIPIVENDAQYKLFYAPLTKYFNDFSPLDMGTCDITRSTIQSYDPDLYLNEDAETWEISDEPVVYDYEEPNIVISDQVKIFEHIKNWHEKNWTGKERNNHLFNVACRFNSYGLDIDTCEKYVLKFQDKDFGAHEILQLVKSAYSYRDSFGKWKLEDKEAVNQIKNKIQCGATYQEIIEEHPDWRAEIKKQWSEIDVSIFWEERERTISIRPMLLKTFLERNRFFKYRLENNETIFVKIEGHFISEVSEEQIKEFVLNNLQSRNEVAVFNLFASNTKVFKRDYLNLLKVVNVDTFNDTEEKAYLKYLNCVVEVSKEGFKRHEYSDLNLFVWRKSVIDREFKESDPSGDYSRFIELLANEDTEKIKCFRSTIGYLMHGYNNPANMKAVILNDSTISDDSQGGTGKSLFNEAISKMCNTSFLDGKSFDEFSQFKFQEVDRQSRVIALDDVRKSFKFEILFSAITGGVTIEQKGKQAERIPFDKTPKFSITTNYAIKGAGNSDARRKHEIEVSDYFLTNRPVDVFNGYLFHQWGADEWAKFDNYMINCLKFYLVNGLIEDKTMNLQLKKLIQKIGLDVYEWFEENEYYPNTKANPNGLTAREYYDNFVNGFKNARAVLQDLTQTKFSRYFKSYCIYKGWDYEGPSGNRKSYKVNKNTEGEQEEDALPF